MNNQYIFTPNIKLNLDIIKSLVYRQLHRYIPGRATHHRFVKDEPYLVSLKRQYPFFSDIYNIYPTKPNYITPIHICPDRSCALNIPIQYTDDSHTIFYELDETASSYRHDERIYDVIENGATEVFRYTLTEPVIMNTLLPHGVIGGPADTRIIMSWSITFDTNYEELRKQYG